MTVTIADIRKAARLLEGAVVRTPSIASSRLSELTGARVVLKLENFQHTGSFKDRGALVKLASLGSRTVKGVVAASAGNHAQGIAHHARRLGVAATIYMPKNTPFNKVARTESLGARVIVQGESFAEAREAAEEAARTGDLAFVHPYDDEKIIAGQGTVGLEMLADDPDLDVVVVPVGGGGLISGVALAAKDANPEIAVIGVQAAAFPSMYAAIRNEPPSGGGQTLADGIAVKTPGTLTRKIVKELVSDIVLVDEAELESAVEVFIRAQRVVAEGAGAASLAALVRQRDRFSGQKVGLVVSGGNIDARLVSSILMRGLVREGKLARLRVEISDSPGTLAEVTSRIGAAGGNIVEIFHQRLFQDVPVKRAEVDVVVETLDGDHVRDLIESLRESGFPTRRLSATADAEAG